jgi:hypothetical protein
MLCDPGQASVDDLVDRKVELEKIWNPLVSRAYANGGDDGDSSADSGNNDAGPDEL